MTAYDLAADEIKLMAAAVASVLAAHAEGRMVPSEGCERRLRLGINDQSWVCGVCRTVVHEPTNFGMCYAGSKTSTGVGLSRTDTDEPVYIGDLLSPLG